MTEKEMFDHFREVGFSKEGAAGLMGNLQAESGLNPHNLQNTFEKKLGMTDDQYTAAVDSGSYDNFVRDGAGYGLAQWTFWTRKQNLLAVARSNNVSIGDINMQLAFLVTELSAYGELWNILQTTADIDKASDWVLKQFEKPKVMDDAVVQKRRQYSREIYARCTGVSLKASETGSSADSALVTEVNWTPKNSGARSEKISKITIHHMAGVMTAKDCMIYHKESMVKASANYYIGKDGEIGQAVKESDRAWTSSSSWNDNRAVTIEVSNSKNSEPWPISGTVYKSLVALCADICKRNGISKVNYTGDKNGILTEHRMFKATSCPGTTIHDLLSTGSIVNDINDAISGNTGSATTHTEKTTADKTITYTVRSGDSLWAIAAKQLGSGARYTEIMEINGLKRSTIRPGQVLKLPQ